MCCALGRCLAVLIRSVEHIASKSRFILIVRLLSQTVSAGTMADVARPVVRTVTSRLVLSGRWDATRHKCCSSVSAVQYVVCQCVIDLLQSVVSHYHFTSHIDVHCDVDTIWCCFMVSWSLWLNGWMYQRAAADMLVGSLTVIIVYFLQAKPVYETNQ